MNNRFVGLFAGVEEQMC